jgi:hypothetical protein
VEGLNACDGRDGGIDRHGIGRHFQPHPRRVALI